MLTLSESSTSFSLREQKLQETKIPVTVARYR